jgi:hypothetical protein
VQRSEYWIGEEIQYESLWKAYESGFAYIDKFRSMRVHLLRVELTQFPVDLPLFNHEAVYKTIQGYFHDFKRACLTHEEYDRAGPLFLYSVNRASGVWNFLGELPLILLFAMTLGAGKVIGETLSDVEAKLRIVQQFFPDTLDLVELQRFMEAETPAAVHSAVQKLLAQGIKQLGVSQKPFDGNVKRAERSIISVTNIINGDLYMSENVGRDKITAKQGSTAIGSNARISKSNFNSIVKHFHGELDLNKLAHELSVLRSEMRKHVSQPEHDLYIGQVAAAEIAATKGDGPTAFTHLKNVGKWVLEFTTQTSAALTAEVIRNLIGLP